MQKNESEEDEQINRLELEEQEDGQESNQEYVMAFED